MSKNIVSGAVALLMVFVPMSAAALTQPSSFSIPTIPQNASIQELLNVIVQLQSILQLLLRTSPTPPVSCPVYNTAICEAGSHLEGGGTLSNGCQAAPRCVPDTPTLPIVNGSLSVATDASSPAFAMVNGGATNVVLGAYKLRATGENQTLQSLRLRLTSGTGSDLARVTIWNGSTQIGSATFVGSSLEATSAIIVPVTIMRDVDTTITIKGDIVNIGPSQPAVPGDIVKVDFAGGVAVGQTSGATISATGSTNVAGVRIVRAYPVVAQASLPTTGMVDGRLIRFSITASASGHVGVAKLSVRVAASNATVSTVILNPYTDGNYSIFAPLPGAPTGIGSTGYNEGSGVMRYEFNFPSGLQIPAGATYYFDVRGSVAAQGSVAAVTTTLLGDAQLQPLGANYPGNPSNFVWSPNSYTTSVFGDNDWMNGYAIPGLPSSGLVQTRSDAGQPLPTTSPTITYMSVSGRTVTASYTDMPVNTQVVIINQTSGARIDSTSAMISGGGSGSVALTLPDDAPAGTYYLKAQNYSTLSYIAQTVAFTISGEASCAAPTITVPAAGYSLGISMPGQGQGITTTGNPSLTITSLPWATLSGTAIRFDSIPAAGTYPITITATNPCGTATRVFNVVVQQSTQICPVYQQPQCSAGQTLVSDPATTEGACTIPHWHCATTNTPPTTRDSESTTVSNPPAPTPPTTQSCTTPTYGLTIPNGGILRAYPYFTGLTYDSAALMTMYTTIMKCSNGTWLTCDLYGNCSDKGGKVSVGSSNISNVAFEGDSSVGNVAGVSISLDQETLDPAALAQVAGVLTAMQDVLHRIISWFKPSAPQAPQPVATTSAPQTAPVAAPTPATPQPSVPSGYPFYTPGGTSAPAPTTAAQPSQSAQLPGATAPASQTAPAPKPTSTGTDNILKATFKGVPLPPVPAATKQLAQALCRADAVCVWNNETITAVGAFGQPGDPTITFMMPEAGKGQTLSAGTGFTFEFKDGSLASGATAANTYRVYLATYSAPGVPDKIYQASVGGIERTASGSVQISWFSRVENADGSTAPIPPGTYYAGAVNIKNGLKGGSTGAITIK